MLRDIKIIENDQNYHVTRKMQNIHINKMIKNHKLREENTQKIYARQKINASKWPKLPCYAHIKRRKTKSAQNPELPKSNT